LELYGVALLAILLVTEIGFLQRLVGTTRLDMDQWLTCIGVAAILLVVEEVIKFFVRRRAAGEMAYTGGLWHLEKQAGEANSIR
jgi:Ca2+-transporting ATPase